MFGDPVDMKNETSAANDPPRVYRRLFGLSYAATAG